MRVALAILVALVATSHADHVPGATAVPPADSVKLSTKTVHVVFDPPIAHATKAQREKLEAGRAIAEQALNDPAIRKRIAYFESTELGGAAGEGYQQAQRKQAGKRVPVASSSEILDALLAGNADDGAIHLPIVIDTEGTSTTLKSYAHTPLDKPLGVTTISGAWLDQEKVTPARVADDLVHEHMHRLGFVHEDGHSLRRCASVPYVVGRLACVFGSSEACFPNRHVRC